MTAHSPFTAYDARLLEFIQHGPGHSACQFEVLALELFALQFAHNPPYRRICEARNQTPQNIFDWPEIPTVPTSAFKELELTSLPRSERIRVFYSSGTTEHRPSRHYHNRESMALYESSLSPWFLKHMLPAADRGADFQFVALTPPASQAPNSSLVHMFEVICQKFGRDRFIFAGIVNSENGWNLKIEDILKSFDQAIASNRPVVVLGTAFSFVHLLDALEESGVQPQLPTGSRVLETGGYKGKSRTLPKTELHEKMERMLGIPNSCIVSEYGMSELSSQAYDRVASVSSADRIFHFPPWARAQVISPETGREVGEGETGLLRIFDLANARSVMAIQTEDLAIRRHDGFELIGRAALAEPRGCSLMPAEALPT